MTLNRKTIWFCIIVMFLFVLFCLALGSIIDYYCFYCKRSNSGCELLGLVYIPSSNGCLQGPNSQHSWAPLTYYGLTWHGHTRFYWAHMGMIEISKYLDFYKMEYGRYPSSEEGLQALRRLWGAKKFNAPLDPEGKPYRYRFSDGEYQIYSYGRDEKPGGHGRDADINLQVSVHK